MLVGNLLLQYWKEAAAVGVGVVLFCRSVLVGSAPIAFPIVVHLTDESHVGVTVKEMHSTGVSAASSRLGLNACFHSWNKDVTTFCVENQSNLCKNCKRPGHYARECPNVAICHNCGLPGVNGRIYVSPDDILQTQHLWHIASECTTKSLCWNCREPGHMASNCPNEGICHTCGKAGHRAKECTAPPMPPGDLRLCNNCYKQGHIAADCTNDKACNNCRKTGHLARECPNEPICNMCNVAGHVARQCPKSNMLGDRGGMRSSGYQDIVCRNCHQYGHMSRDCMGPLMICHNCGGRGHRAIECPSGRMMDRYPQRFYR
ncbi:hypothetical protein POTOM_015960 [Populus tomentosa]|uniref:CCHC-type domain-containing protein n=1 Tax=Populus tomentosa TaxID=118781 RepID=A0A8X8A824_POPTO|nr:hypothetical protein POTOM_015960 [Populus tomentosa]